jgi:N-[(2S)-2-amino-2-carboxyethyl]-L-glutamate dehydrogenase
MSKFYVVPGAVSRSVIEGKPERVLERVRDAYLLHDAGESINPDSYFLRFPEKPDSRVIALPAYLGGDVDRAGLKWISSFPGNHERGIPRASAVLILNDYATGYPVACLEAAGISAARTAASAALAAAALARSDRLSGVGVVGTGVIAMTILRFLGVAGLNFDRAFCHDLVNERAVSFAEQAASLCGIGEAGSGSLPVALDQEVVIFATTAGSPYLPADWTPRSDQLVLNISLRDIAPETLLRVDNIVDDVEHCLKAQTSPHLAEQLSGGRDFINGTLGALLGGSVDLDEGRATIFSPFGLGILDIAVGAMILEDALGSGTAIEIPGFFPA